MNKKIILFPILFALIDQIWLQGASSFHRSTLEGVQKSKLEFTYVAGILWYLLAGLAYYYFVMSSSTPFKTGFLMGLMMYGSFDLTNKFIFKEYSWKYAISDMVWGSFCFGITSVLLSKL